MADPFGTSDCGAGAIAAQEFTALAADHTFTLPAVDLTSAEFQLPAQLANPLYDAVNPLTNDDLTTKVVGGTGTFDTVMTANKAHLQEEYDAGRITGDQYSKAYIELTGIVLQSSVQYLLGRDNAYWQAVLTQASARKAEIEAVAAAVGLETAKTQLAIASYQAQTSKAEYALTKMKIATEDAKFCLAKAQTAQSQYQTSDILPAQKVLVTEQAEVQRAQTLDTRSDGLTAIAGSVGKQKDLYDQQIVSYQRDSEYKAGKMYLDAWITQKTLDEGLLAPAELTNVTIDTVLNKVRTNNGLV